MGKIFNRSSIREIEDILHIYMSDYLNTIPKHLKNGYSRNGLIKKIFFIVHSFLFDTYIFFYKKNKNLSDKWVFYLSMNNYDSTRFLEKEIKDIEFYFPKTNFHTSSHEKFGKSIYYKRKYLYDLLFPVFFIFYLIHCNTKKLAIERFDSIYHCFGIYFESIRILKKQKPSVIIFSNDHLITSRSLIKAAKTLNIKTVYIQHASISKFFPKLDFGLALLDGKNTYDIYKNIGKIYSKVEFIGMPKFDDYCNLINYSDKLTVIGIAYNEVDDIKIVAELIHELKNHFLDKKLIVRKHPNDTRILNTEQLASISNPKEESSFEFLKKIDLLISCESSIHLEATLLNVVSVYYKLNNNNIYDYYGYIKNDLIEEVEDIKELNLLIKKLSFSRPNVINRAKYYNCTINTPDFGNSKKLAVRKILEYTKQ
jgi:hypothetical protein